VPRRGSGFRRSRIRDLEGLEAPAPAGRWPARPSRDDRSPGHTSDGTRVRRSSRPCPHRSVLAAGPPESPHEEAIRSFAKRSRASGIVSIRPPSGPWNPTWPSSIWRSTRRSAHFAADPANTYVKEHLATRCGAKLSFCSAPRCWRAASASGIPVMRAGLAATFSPPSRSSRYRPHSRYEHWNHEIVAPRANRSFRSPIRRSSCNPNHA